MTDAWGRHDNTVPIFSSPAPRVVANGYMIESGNEDGLAAYFSLKTRKLTGATHGWTHEAGEALQFARRQDAEDFAQAYLLNMTVKVVGRNG